MWKIILLAISLFFLFSVNTSAGTVKRIDKNGKEIIPCLNDPNKSKEEIQKELEVTLFAIWNKMSQAVIDGDLETALSYYDDWSKKKYRRIYSEWDREKAKRVFGNIKTLHVYSLDLKHGRAEVGLVREENGMNYSYPARFMRNPINCVWRLQGL
jgi:hypothetical protein